MGLAVDQRDIDRRPGERARREQAAEATADDHDAVAAPCMTFPLARRPRHSRKMVTDRPAAKSTDERTRSADGGFWDRCLLRERPWLSWRPRALRRGGTVANVYDVIIIGSGAGGGTLALELAPTGKRILILERGGWLPREKRELGAPREVFVENRYVSHGDLVRQGRQALSAGHPLLRRRRDQDVRGGACIGCAKRTSARSGTTTASRPRGRSGTTRWSPTTRGPSSSTRSTARAARIRPSRPRARPIRIPPCRTSRASSSSATTSCAPAIARSTRPAASC